MVPTRDYPAVDLGVQMFGMGNNACVERVGKSVLPGATRSEYPCDARLVQEILSASIPDFAHHET